MGSFQYGMLVEQVATTATAAGTTTLTNVSKQVQIFTGSTTQTVILPDASTMSVGQFFEIYNQSSGALTIQFNGATSFTDASGQVYSNLAAHTTLIVKLQTNGTSAGTWSVVATPASVGIITSSNVNTATFTAPTVQKFTSGSGTYTTPTSPRTPLYLKVRMAGGGGAGGSGGSTGATGSDGTNSTFGSSLLTANGGAAGTGGGAGGAAGGAGGGATITTSSTVLQVVASTGGSGGGGDTTNASTAGSGGYGGSNAFGGAGGGGSGNLAAGGAAGVTNTGAGGGGGSADAGASTGGGGGAGGYLEAIITSPSSTYSYAVGTGGTAGSAGTNATTGGNGGSGYIVIEEFYQ